MMRNYLTGLIAKTLSKPSLPLSHCIKSSTVPQKFFHSAAPASDHHWWWRAVNLRRKARREPVSLIGNYILYVHPGKCFLLPNVYKTPKPMTKPVSPVSQCWGGPRMITSDVIKSLLSISSSFVPLPRAKQFLFAHRSSSLASQNTELEAH